MIREDVVINDHCIRADFVVLLAILEDPVDELVIIGGFAISNLFFILNSNYKLIKNEFN